MFMFLLIVIAVMIIVFVSFAVLDDEKMTTKDKIQSVASMVTAATAIISVIFTGYQLEQQNKKVDDTSQVNQVSVWVEPEVATGSAVEYVHISNQSAQPIYDVGISIDEVDERKTSLGKYNAQDCKFIQCIPIGEYKVEVKSQRDKNKEYNASISFRDANGQNWYRDAAGNLRKTGESKAIRDIPDTVKSAEYDVD